LCEKSTVPITGMSLSSGISRRGRVGTSGGEDVCPMTTRNSRPARPVAAKNSARPTTNWSSRSTVVAQPSSTPKSPPTTAAARTPTVLLPEP
jgi:hypothetical protein